MNAEAKDPHDDYFILAVKTQRRDLFNREMELRQLEETVSSNSRKDRATLQKIVDRAVKIVEKETSKIIAKSKHYRFILKALSTGERKWKILYDYLELNEGHVSDSTFTDSLTYLIKHGILTKDNIEDVYSIADPIIAEYAKKL